MEILHKLIKTVKIYIRTTLKCKEFDTLSNKRQKNIVKKVKKACRRRWFSLHAGVNAVFDEYEGSVKNLQKIQSDHSLGSLATVLLQKIKDHEFLGTLYLLKFMLSKTFQTRCLNFCWIVPAINRCKTKTQEIERKGYVWAEF